MIRALAVSIAALLCLLVLPQVRFQRPRRPPSKPGGRPWLAAHPQPRCCCRLCRRLLLLLLATPQFYVCFRDAGRCQVAQEVFLGDTQVLVVHSVQVHGGRLLQGVTRGGAVGRR